MQYNDWYRVENIEEIDSPVLLVFPERARKNIQTAIRMTGDVNRLRPHVKTHKSLDIAREMRNAGISKFKCATIAEAEMLALANAEDVLLAYQPAGPKLDRFIEVIKKYPATTYSCLVDNLTSATSIAAAFSRQGLIPSVYLDLNVGMNRTGILPGPPAIELYTYCASTKGINIKGIHAYDGHIRNKDLAQRTIECDAAFAAVLEMKDDWVKLGLPAPVIIAGGSHSFPVHSHRAGIECSPGTFIYWDQSNTDWCPEQDFLPAAVLVSRIVSLPAENLVCCDLGHKSVAAENVITERVYFLNATELVAVSQSEEHLVLRAHAGHSYKAGDVLYGLPNHICPTVALYESVRIVEDGKVTGEWKTVARDRKISI